MKGGCLVVVSDIYTALIKVLESAWGPRDSAHKDRWHMVCVSPLVQPILERFIMYGDFKMDGGMAAPVE